MREKESMEDLIMKVKDIIVEVRNLSDLENCSRRKDITVEVRRNLSDLENCSRRWRGRRKSMRERRRKRSSNCSPSSKAPKWRNMATRVGSIGRNTDVLIMRRQTNMEKKEESVKRGGGGSTDFIIDSLKNVGPINNHYLQ